jgi:two-component system, NarL family, response regulator
MPKKSGLQVTAELAPQRGLNPGIVVMTAFDGEENIRQALSAGARAFLVKGSEPEEIRDAVRSVARGERYLPANIGLKLADSVSRPELSRRETEVLQYLARGRSNKEIGQYLCVSEGTVKHHVKSILGKLGAIGRAEAIAIAARRGLVHLV